MKNVRVGGGACFRTDDFQSLHKDFFNALN